MNFSSPLPADEQDRLIALRSYNILDTAPEPEFDGIAFLAAQICDTPTATVTLVDEKRQWFKSRVAMVNQETHRDLSLCAYTILTKNVFVVQDASKHPIFATYDNVTGSPYIRFYAGAPIIDANGHGLGTVAVIDYVPREISDKQKQALVVLSKQVLAQLELRKHLAIERRLIVERAESVLQHSELKSSALLESALDCIIAINHEGSIIEFNPAAEKTFGYFRQNILGQNMADLIIPAALREKHRRGLQTYLKTGIGPMLNKRIEMTALRSDGSEFPVELTIARIGQAEPPTFTGFIRDITERKRSEESLKRLALEMQQLLESAGEGIYGMNTHGRCTFINRLGAQMLGYSPDELLGKKMHELIHHHHEDGTVYEETDCPIFLTYRAGNKCRIESDIFWRSDGTYFPVEYSSHPLILNKEITGSVITFSDITERIRAAGKMAEQAALLDQARDAILVRDLEGHITFWNKGAEHLYGWTREEALGRVIQDLIYKDKSKFDEAHVSVLRYGEWSGELNHIAKDSSEIIVAVRWTLVRDRLGAPKAVLAINTDVTDQKKIEAQFFRSQRMESIGTLAGGIAHDLNNILTPIIISTGLLKTQVKGKSVQQLVGTIESSAHRGAEILRQILSFARGVDGERVELDARSLVKDVETFIKDTFPKDIRLELSIPKDLGMVRGDSTQLNQVLLNLCLNARDAMPQGGTLQLGLEKTFIDEAFVKNHPQAQSGQYVVIGVGDSGMGIAPEIVDKIFEPFFTTKKFGKGTGLGLSTVMAIIKSHHGFLTVESKPGKGSLFQIYLPTTDASRASKDSISTKYSLPIGHGETVLLVDDEEPILRVVSQSLTKYGYNVITAPNGAEALARYAEHRAQINVVVTDMMMPEINGSTLIRKLKVMNPELKFITTSGYIERAKGSPTESEVVGPFLNKPYTAQELLTILNSVLNEVPEVEHHPV